MSKFLRRKIHYPRNRHHRYNRNRPLCQNKKHFHDIDELQSCTHRLFNFTNFNLKIKSLKDCLFDEKSLLKQDKHCCQLAWWIRCYSYTDSSLDHPTRCSWNSGHSHGYQFYKDFQSFVQNIGDTGIQKFAIRLNKMLNKMISDYHWLTCFTSWNIANNWTSLFRRGRSRLSVPNVAPRGRCLTCHNS